MGLFFISLKLIILTTNGALNLMQSKQNCGLIIPMYTINILMGSFNINNEIYYYFKNNIT
jgi:hypothetical protein